jgi:hypothetical protein
MRYVLYYIKVGCDDNFFLFEVGLNFFIKAYLFLLLKNAFKKVWIFFSCSSNKYFLMFLLLFWCDEIKNRFYKIKKILSQYIYIFKNILKLF